MGALELLALVPAMSVVSRALARGDRVCAYDVLVGLGVQPAVAFELVLELAR